MNTHDYYTSSMELPGYDSVSPVSSTHECFVCGDIISLSDQVCSRFCMRTMEQLDFMDSLEAQLECSSQNEHAVAVTPIIVPHPSPACLPTETR
jgi:hypothetical protein